MLTPPRVGKCSHLAFHGEAQVGVLGSQQEMFAGGQEEGAPVRSFQGSRPVRALAPVLTLSPSSIQVRERWAPVTEVCPSTRTSSASRARLSVTVMGKSLKSAPRPRRPALQGDTGSLCLVECDSGSRVCDGSATGSGADRRETWPAPRSSSPLCVHKSQLGAWPVCTC